MVEENEHEHGHDNSSAAAVAIKVVVDPGKPPQLTWQRKLNNHANSNVPSEFTLSFKEMIHLAPIGYRLWRHVREEASKGRIGMIDPFAKRHVTSSHGVPLGGVGWVFSSLSFLIFPSFHNIISFFFSSSVQEALEEVLPVNFSVGNYCL